MVEAPDRTLEWIITLIAASLSTFGFIPQMLHTLRTRRTHDLSLTAFIMFSVGLVVWVYLGLLYKNWIMIGYDIVNLALCLLIVRMKLKYG